jgi:branched-chain amino acid transport system substrate-binding protein
MNITKLVKVVIPILLIAALVIISACAPKAPPGAVINVGVVADISGPASTSCLPIFQGITDYYNYVNEELGGIDGIKLAVSWGDTKFDSATAVTFVNQFIDQGAVLINGSNTVDVMGSRTALDTAKIPAVGIFATKELLLPPDVYYAALPEAGQQFATHVNWYYSNIWKEKGLDRPMRVAIIAWDMATGRTVAEGVKRWIEMQPAGVAELAYEAYPSATTVDYTPELLAAKAANPDVIVGGLYGAGFGMLLRDCGKAGLAEDIPVLLWTGCFEEAPRELAGSEVDRAYASFQWVMPDEEDKYEEAKIANHLAQTMRNLPEFTSDYAPGVMTGIISLKAIEMALKQVGYDNLDGAAVMEYGLQQMCNADLGVGPLINYCEGSRVGPVAFRITKWNAQTQREEVISDWVQTIPLAQIYPEG